MRYGDVTFTENGKLGEIESLIAMIGTSKRGQKEHQEISFEEYLNEQLNGSDSDFWYQLPDRERKDRYKTELENRADIREIFAGFEEDYKQQLEEKLKGVDLGIVSHYLNERKKTYQEAQAKQNNEDALQKIENASQIEATIYAQNKVKVLDAKSKSKN